MSKRRDFVGFGLFGAGIYAGLMECAYGRAQFGVTLMCAGVALMLTVLHPPGRHPVKPGPDYAAIARMELEVYGEPFEHEGAPKAVKPQVPWGISMAEAVQNMSALTASLRESASWICPDCGSPLTRSALSVSAHQYGGCLERRQRRLESRPGIVWDQWCTCGKKFSSTVAKNERAIATHKALGKCPHVRETT